jgi:LCP family protein required for cell wall assembly
MRRPGFRTEAPVRVNQMGIGTSSAPSSVINRPSRPVINPITPSASALPLEGTQPRKHGRRASADEKPKGNLYQRFRAVHWKKVLKRTAITAAVVFVGWGGFLGWKIIHDTSKIFGGHGNLLGFLSTTELKGEAQGRVNILLAGDSTDDPGHQGADLTDSIMILSIDTKNNTAFMLSIPRDLWVNLPDGMGYQKINAANTDTEFSKSGYPKGGMGALEYTISQDFGIPIDYDALINYTAFRDAVNAVGGVTINVNSPDPRGLYDPNTGTKLPNGNVKLTGQTALNLARSRGDGYGSYGFPDSDFDRTMYQREIGLAIKSKVMSTGVLANPIKLGQVFDAIGNNVKTDLSTSDVRTLYDLFKKINNSSIQSIGLNSTTYDGQKGVDLLSNYTDPSSGEEALVPSSGIGNYSEFQLLLTELTSNNPVVKEAANVVVLNGGNTVGLAAKEQTLLTSKGINVSAIGDAPSTISNTLIVDQSGGKMPNTKAALVKLYGNNVTTTNNYGYPSADFVVVLGVNQPTPTTSSSGASTSATTGD